MSYMHYQKLAQELLQNTTDPKMQESLERLRSVLDTEEGKRLAETATEQWEDSIARIMDAARVGDQARAKKELNQIMATPKGAAMVSKILTILQK